LAAMGNGEGKVLAVVKISVFDMLTTSPSSGLGIRDG